MILLIHDTDDIDSNTNFNSNINDDEKRFRAGIRVRVQIRVRVHIHVYVQIQERPSKTQSSRILWQVIDMTIDCFLSVVRLKLLSVYVPTKTITTQNIQ